MTTPHQRKVFIHVGLPKTGTTFLQRSLAQARGALRQQGLLYPGKRNDHFLPALDVLGWDFHGYEDPRRVGAWDALRYEISQWRGSVLISHEILAAATPSQIDRIVEARGGLPRHTSWSRRAIQRVNCWQSGRRTSRTARLGRSTSTSGE